MPVILKNNASSTLATAISASDTGIVVADGSKFPSLGASDYFYATLVSSGGTTEIVKVTARASNSMTVVRAQDGSSAASFASGALLEMRVNAASVTDLVDEHDQAAEISIADAGNYYTSTNVEGALQEAAQASTTRITDAGNYYTSTNVEGALQEVGVDFAAFAASSGSTLVGYSQGGTGSVQRTVQSRLRDVVSVKDFGAVGDGVTDDYAAFLAASTYCNDNDVHSLLIPPASYHLSEPWFVPQGGNYVLCRTVADGAVVDNTVIAQNGAGIAGLTVDGAPDAGFVFTRGQGAYHEYLVAKNCDSYGFYFGVASRQHLTVASSSGFQVGETVTGATSGKTGVVERITGNVLRLVKCNIAGTAGFFTSSETVTGGTSGASTTVSSVSTPYGSNYQVTRATFNQLLAYNNANKGFCWDGTATANRSYMNATTWISPSGVSNGGKGWVVSSYTGPGGSSEHNYNTFININMEGNADKSLVDPSGRQNTYIGGHFVDTDGGGESVAITDAYNFILGGRYIGSQDLSGVSFSFYNSDVGAIKSTISGVDSFSTDNLDAANEPLFYKGWSILPSSKLTYTVASDNINNHTLAINMGDFINGNYINMRVFIGGFRNQSGGYDQTDHAQLTMVMSSQAGSTTTHHVSHAVASTEGISVDSVTISTAGVISITFDTTNQIFTTQNVVEFYSNDPVDPR